MMATIVEVICNLKLWELGISSPVRVASTRLRQLVPESWGACCNGPNLVCEWRLESATAGRQVEEEDLRGICLECPSQGDSMRRQVLFVCARRGRCRWGYRIGRSHAYCLLYFGRRRVRNGDMYVVLNQIVPKGKTGVVESQIDESGYAVPTIPSLRLCGGLLGAQPTDPRSRCPMA